MSRCWTCGIDLGYKGGRRCYGCKKAWSDRRKTAYDQAVAENGGELTKANLKKVQARIKQLEKDMKEESNG